MKHLEVHLNYFTTNKAIKLQENFKICAHKICKFLTLKIAKVEQPTLLL